MGEAVRPLVIELFAGRFGWGKGFVAHGWSVVGFDILHEPYHGPVPEGCELVMQDVLTLNGRQFRDAAAIVASPPCQAYSFMAMPFSRGKAIAANIREGGPEGPAWYSLNGLFNACFRLQREASEAAGRYIPMVVENVKGAQPWVGRARAHYGSFYLWSDVDSVGGRIVARGARFGDTLAPTFSRKVKSKYAGHGSWQTEDGLDWRDPANMGQAEVGRKVPGFNFHEYEKTGQPGRSFQSAAVGVKVPSESGRRTDVGKGARTTTRDCGIERDGVKQPGLSGPLWLDGGAARLSSGSNARRAASAAIAEIPPPLAAYFARCWHPDYAGTPQRTISAATADCAMVEAVAP